MRDRNRAVRQAIPVTTTKDDDQDPDVLPISDEDSVDSLSTIQIQNLREVFGTIHIMMMSHLLQREH
jgi:hypothetical protein